MLPANNMGDAAVIDKASRHSLNSARSLNKDALKIEGAGIIQHSGKEGPCRVGLRNLPDIKIPATCEPQPELLIWNPGPTL